MAVFHLVGEPGGHPRGDRGVPGIFGDIPRGIPVPVSDEGVDEYVFGSVKDIGCEYGKSDGGAPAAEDRGVEGAACREDSLKSGGRPPGIYGIVPPPASLNDRKLTPGICFFLCLYFAPCQ